MKDYKKIVGKYSSLMTDAEDYIWHNAEIGYKEFKTDKYMAEAFTSLGYKIERMGDITGFVSYYDTGKPGPTVLVLAELDALLCSGHPEVNKETGAAHVCGHNTQCASILGLAAALKEHGGDFDLSGKVKFCIVPSEEGIDIAWRTEQINKGVITFTSGKPEYIKRGLLSDVDAAFMMHTFNGENRFEDGFCFSVGANGVIRKTIEIIGKSAHAGGAPWDGINALYAAEIALAACNALRETFTESDCIRFHPIITKGGESVNAIPDKVIIESYVRGSNNTAMKEANDKINRAVTGACLAMGASVKISDLPGSAPRNDDQNLTELMYAEACELVGKERCIIDKKWRTSSTDMGDISALVPSVHFYVDGFRGAAHDKGYVKLPPKPVCENAAALHLATVVKLLENGGAKCMEINKSFVSPYASVEEYVRDKQSLGRVREPIKYNGSNAEITFD